MMIQSLLTFFSSRTGYIIRIDDIAPQMNWDAYFRVKELFGQYEIKPVLGVIPDNKDPELKSYPTCSFNFWDEMRSVQGDGWEIAMHGYTHVYDRHRVKDYLGLGGKKGGAVAVTSMQDLGQFKTEIDLAFQEMGDIPSRVEINYTTGALFLQLWQERKNTFFPCLEVRSHGWQICFLGSSKYDHMERNIMEWQFSLNLGPTTSNCYDLPLLISKGTPSSATGIYLSFKNKSDII